MKLSKQIQQAHKYMLEPGDLERVVLYVDDDGTAWSTSDPIYVVLALIYDQKSVYVLVHANDDSLSVTSKRPRFLDDMQSHDLTGQAPWSACVGYGPMFTWILTNQNGYFDGIQWQFGILGTHSQIVQIQSAASTLSLQYDGKVESLW